VALPEHIRWLLLLNSTVAALAQLCFPRASSLIVLLLMNLLYFNAFNTGALPRTFKGGLAFLGASIGRFRQRQQRPDPSL